MSEDFITTLYDMHDMGAPFAKTLVVYGFGFSVGKYFVRALRGIIRFSVAIADIIRDTIIIFIVGYFIGLTGIGEKIFGSGDSPTMGILRTIGGGSTEWFWDAMNLFIGTFQALGINFAALPNFTLTMSALLIGGFIGVIFGIVFS